MTGAACYAVALALGMLQPASPTAASAAAAPPANPKP
jgi:hypothetical protein